METTRAERPLFDRAAYLSLSAIGTKHLRSESATTPTVARVERPAVTLSLARRADLWGSRTALVDASADRRVSYADLDAEADATARRLAAFGVEPGDAVATVSRNRVGTLALLFAVRRLGAAFAPVSHRLTPATVTGPLAAVDPELVVHETAQRDLVREVDDHVSVSFEELAREDPTDYESVDPDPEDSLLYLPEATDEATIAGTEATGARVADLPASAVEWNCITAVAAWGLGRGDCAPALLPFSDAAGLLGLTLPLLYVGGRVVVLRAFDPEDALAAVAETGATALVAGATEYRELVACERFETTDFGGVAWAASRSALPADVREALARKTAVVRTYGSAATGPNDLFVPPASASGGSPDADATPDGRQVAADASAPDSADVSDSDRADVSDSGRADVSDSGRVGRPFPDCEARVVDADGEPLPESEVGELHVRGPVTARGYLAGGDDGERPTSEFPEWVPTGDRAVREGGDYYLLGSETT